MQIYVNVFFNNLTVVHSKVDCVFQDILRFGWVEVVNVEDDEFVLVLIWYVGQPVDYGQGVFPLIQLGLVFYSGIDFFKDLFADTSYFTLCWVNKSAGGPVVFVVFQGYVCLSCCRAFYSILYFEVGGDVMCFLIYGVNGVVACFLVS